MNFIEAVTALNEGRCKGIKREYWSASYLRGEINRIAVPSESYTATDWELVDETPQFEEVEVVRWECGNCGHYYKYGTEPGDDPCCNQRIFLKLTGTYKRPLPKKVKRRAEHGCYGSYDWVSDIITKSNATAKFTAEWEEEVRG